MVESTLLGFPRFGANRELKKLVESFWAGKIETPELLRESKNIRENHWKILKDLGLSQVPCGDFSLYDNMLDHCVTFGCVPKRYVECTEKGVERFFAMAKGLQREATPTAPAVDVPAMEMKKWFDTNYHFLVPEFEHNQSFTLDDTRVLDHFLDAKQLGIDARPVLIGPVTFLLLGKCPKNSSDVTPLSLLPKLLAVYKELVEKLAQAGAEWIQIDEPILVMDFDDKRAEVEKMFQEAYNTLGEIPGIKLMIATYFESIESNVDMILNTPINGLHLDLVRAPEQLNPILSKLPESLSLSLGVVDGRNIWKSDLDKALKVVQEVVAVLGPNRVAVSASCSLLHLPFSLQSEEKMDPEIKDWLCFAIERTQEVINLAKGINEGKQSIQKELDDNWTSLQSRRTSTKVHNSAVKDATANITPEMKRRNNVFHVRKSAQQKHLGLPLLPTTTIGSFPQTREVRRNRLQLKKGTITHEEYFKFVKAETERCIRFQESVGIDVLVDGEFDRNDMVEFFGTKLDGFVFTQNGWVQSYGSRGVKPPIIFGDVDRPAAMTVEVSKYAQSLTDRPVKGILTGPVTILQWSFCRDDQPESETAYQIALAVRKEVKDLEANGIKIIQVDEAAIREGLPLKKSKWNTYLQWAVDSFLVSSCGVEDSTQIHTHMCYSDFNDIIAAIERMDADVVTIENSRSDEKLVDALKKRHYPNDIGPGLYDIHSPRVPSVEEMKQRLSTLLKVLKPEQVWVNPDCGLKTRGWKEVEASLENLINVAKDVRKTLAA